MANKKLVAAAIPALLAALPVYGQVSHPFGVQVRAALPMDSVGQATGKKPALGASIQAEMDLEDGWRWRLAFGGDRWGPGTWSGRTGVKGEVSAVHLEVEFIRLLRPDTETDHLGPYLSAGFRFINWNVSSVDAVLDVKTSRNVIHAGGSVGLGYRLTPWLDGELKLFHGRVDPGFSGGAMTVGVTVRF